MTPVKVLVTGANGMVGQSLIRLLLQQGYTVIGTGRGERRSMVQDPNLHYYAADITHPFDLQLVLQKELPEVVVHAAAMAGVDDCERLRNEAHAINVEATARLLLDAETYSKYFVFLSTDFVFDGQQGMYREDADPNPISWYGQTKLEAEAVVQTAEIPWAIVRTCLVYGKKPEGGRDNLYGWVLNSLRAGKAIQVVDDQWRTPTWVEDLSTGIALLIGRRATGIWHLSGPDRWTPYRMALEIAALHGLPSELISRVTATEFSQPGRRPPLTGFNISKARRELHYTPGALLDNLRRLQQG